MTESLGPWLRKARNIGKRLYGLAPARPVPVRRPARLCPTCRPHRRGPCIGQIFVYIYTTTGGLSGWEYPPQR